MHFTSQSCKFTKKNRLAGPSAYKTVFRSGHRGVVGGFNWYARRNRTAAPRLGIAVPKRWIKKAIQRNRIKRKIRESFRVNQYKLFYLDIVVVVRRPIEDEHQIQPQLEAVWMKISEIE